MEQGQKAAVGLGLVGATILGIWALTRGAKAESPPPPPPGPNYLFSVLVDADNPEGVDGAILDQSPSGFVTYTVYTMRIGLRAIRIYVAEVQVKNSVYDYPDQLRERYLLDAVKRAIRYDYIAVTYPEGITGPTYLAYVSYGINHPDYLEPE
ncbi:hypothetical protein LCGC14_1379630 [marine sediment metagenome]|uniref:Uncharacterized protein n=1 Tax=marine sediment metagenome TaxID=412755 RepID=A0A0F9N4Q4_9ZZZZ